MHEGFQCSRRKILTEVSRRLAKGCSRKEERERETDRSGGGSRFASGGRFRPNTLVVWTVQCLPPFFKSKN